MTTKNTVWLIDDDPALRLILEDTFNDAGLNVVVFSNARGAWAKLNDVLHSHRHNIDLPDVILTDIRMPLMDGLSFSDWVHKHFAQIPIVIMTAHSDLKSAVDSYQTGAFEYLPKPFDLDDAVAIIKKAIHPRHNHGEHSKTTQKITQDEADSTESNSIHNKSAKTNLKTQSTSDLSNNSVINTSNTTINSQASKNQHTKNDPHALIEQAKPKNDASIHRKKNNNGNKKESSMPTIIGQSQAMQNVFRAIGRLATSPITVLITGESGTGKELVAGALHQHSPRHDKPFIALNMAAIPHDLIESELFGHEKGAFTGATAGRQGRFEQANGGTLFLDEIGDMPAQTQTRLLRVLANGEFFRVGGQRPIKVDVRIIAATHQNLEQLVKEGKFREDLFYRLNVIRLPLPPLRARPDDIAELVDFFMARAAVEMNSKQKQLSQDALQLMQMFNWAGNVRQLENACRWITVMATGDMVLIEDLPPELIEFSNKMRSQSTPTQNLNSQPILQHQQPLNSASPTPPNLHLNLSQNDTSNVNESIKDWHNNSHDYLTTQIPASQPQHAMPTELTWQQQLQSWANQALKEGHNDILRLAMPEFEKVLIKVALAQTNGRKGEAADLLGWGRNTLTRKMKQLDFNNDI